MLHLGQGKGLCEGISDHIACGAKYQPQLSIFDNPSNKMKMHVNMLSACVVLVVLCKSYCRLIIREESCGFSDGVEKISNE
jgi:hypothetical protein